MSCVEEQVKIVKELPQKKMGRLLMLGEDLDRQVQAYLLELGKVGGMINNAIAIASARGIFHKRDNRMLAHRRQNRGAVGAIAPTKI